MAQAAGWFGKLPALGDFAQRRLDAGFVSRWDSWLQAAVLASQHSLGSRWLEVYLTAHVWRFVLLPGVLDAQSHAGVLMPSVDRVGRYFPLTVCTALSADVLADAANLDAWLDSLESVARGALDPAKGVEGFEANLLSLGLPQLTRFGSAAAQATALGIHSAQASCTLDFAAQGVAAGLDDIARALLARSLAAHSLWWCRDTGGLCAGFALAGLPEAHVFATMLGYSPAP